MKASRVRGDEDHVSPIGQQRIRPVPLQVIVLTHDEAENITACLQSVASWTRQLVIVDSGSRDNTLAIAESFGALILHHEFTDHRSQWQWALHAAPSDCSWVLGLDADQRVSDELREELQTLFSERALQGVDGLYVKRRQIFRGRWVRHGGYYPKYLLKIFRRDEVFFDDRDLVDHHFHVSGPTRKLRNDIIEDNAKERDLRFWIAKHRGYAALHAREEILRRDSTDAWPLPPAFLGTPDQRTLRLKQLWYHLPLFVRPVLYFSYRFVLRAGFLDGSQGILFHILHGLWYRLLVDVHLHRLLTAKKQDPSITHLANRRQTRRKEQDG